MSDSSVKYTPPGSENFTTVYNGAYSAPACLNNTIKSVKSCTTAREVPQRQYKSNNKVVCINSRINNQHLANRVQTLEDKVKILSKEIQSITKVGNLNGECVSHITDCLSQEGPDLSSESVRDIFSGMSCLTISPEPHYEIVGGKRSRRRRRKSVKRKRKQSKKNHRKTRR